MSTYVDNPTPIRPEIEIEPVLSFVSVAPIKQPIRLNDTIHWLHPYESYGLVTRNELARDYETYRALQLRLEAGEVLTHDEALRGDLSIDRVLRLALPTITDDEWEGIGTSDKQTILAFFLEISNQTERARQEAQKRMPMRSTLQPLGQNSPDSTEPIRSSGTKSRRKSRAPIS